MCEKLNAMWMLPLGVVFFHWAAGHDGLHDALS